MRGIALAIVGLGFVYSIHSKRVRGVEVPQGALNFTGFWLILTCIVIAGGW